MKLDSFKHLYIEELRDLYDAENQLLAGLPAVAETAVLPKLKEAFANHLEQTKIHKSLDEEGEMNKLLNSLALRSVNVEAVEATDEQSELGAAVVSALEATE